MTLKKSLISSKLRHVLRTTTKLEAQFNTNRKLRQEALKNRIGQLGCQVSNVRYRLVHAFADDDISGIKFPFIFEIAILRTPSLSHSYVVNGINSSARYDNPFVGKYTDTYVWITSGGKQQEAVIWMIKLRCGMGFEPFLHSREVMSTIQFSSISTCH